MEVAFEHQVTGCIILWKTSINNTKPKVAESENIEANHLGFAKSFNHYPAESAFNFYVNHKITKCLGGTVNIKAARENFYTELFQHTNLPRNYSFAPIIRKINQTIEKVELPTALSYHYTSGSAINILSVDVSTSNKEDLLRPYGAYFEGFKSQLPTPSRIQLLLPQPDFETTTPWELSKEEEEEELEDQEFTYQNLITENPEQNLNLEISEIKTPNHQRQNNSNPELNNQQNLLLVIVIDQLPINLIAEPIQQPLQLSPQQPGQQQLLQ
ncbi:hypothetical protein G9A89_021238 [Geosiphon pyriformis]|nr:hypothetical protein G9A89_021238 [Geosiphon pyriformis]